MRLHHLLPLLLTLAVAPACATGDRGAVATGPQNAPATAFPVEVTLQRPDGGAFPMFSHLGSTFVAGENGQRYAIRLANRTARRVEAVVTVDGRDVITGELGNFRQQRGYVIEPFGSVVIDGFRQSLDHVAAFRFTNLADSYSARRGTPQHVGVVGVAVFEERRSRRDRQRKAFAAQPQGPRAAPSQPFPEADASAERSAPRGAAAPAAQAEDAAAAPPRSESGGFAPPAGGELGTQYGETTTSHVREVEFERRRKRKPDAVIALQYDTPQGLMARGVPIHSAPAIAIGSDPDPFPG